MGLPFSVLKQTPTLQQMVAWGWVRPSRESRREKTRITFMPARPDPRHQGICVMCLKRREVNADDQCARCWARSFGWLELRLEPRPPPSSGRLTAAAAYADVGGRWDSYFDEEDDEEDHGPGWGLGKDYHPPARMPVPPLRQIRPWQRWRWQVEDQWRVDDYGKKYRTARRTAPERLHPSKTHGVSLRCLVCLAQADTLRRDQVCEACERDWRRKGRPWGIKYERWLIDRRLNQWEKSHEHLFAYESAQFVKVVRGSFSENMPVTRDDTDSSLEIWDNGSSGSRGTIISTPPEAVRMNASVEAPSFTATQVAALLRAQRRIDAADEPGTEITGSDESDNVVRMRRRPS